MLKSRDEVIRECTLAAVACWDHYSDTPLGGDFVNDLRARLIRIFPQEIAMDEWERYAARKAAERVAEDASEGVENKKRV